MNTSVLNANFSDRLSETPPSLVRNAVVVEVWLRIIHPIYADHIGVVLRVDSPGGSALASDVIWRAIRKVSRAKPVVASMVDVAASRCYYLSMACDQIFAEELTITGSIVQHLSLC